MITRLGNLFRKNEDGIAAVEFAVLAPVFFAVMSAMFEISYFAYSSTSFQRAVEDAIDSIRTGHVYSTMLTNGWNPEQWYRHEICGDVSIPNCEEELEIQVQTFSSSFDLYKDSASTGTVDVGASGILMRVEARIELPKLALTGVVFGEEPIMATAGLTFMTEPY